MGSAIVAYVADQSRIHQVLVSIASWRRFADHQVAIVDIGLSEQGKWHLEKLTGRRVSFINPAQSGLEGEPNRHAIAFEQKSLLGLQASGEPIVFLDADILVTHPSALNYLTSVPKNTLFAAVSAWDCDFSWTYTEGSLAELQRCTRKYDLRLTFPIVNSGVWAMQLETARMVCRHWSMTFRNAVNSKILSPTIRLGTTIGDQEFLLPACESSGADWESLHGSFNMQVHENRMPWQFDNNHPFGGHKHEVPGPVRAIHFGCHPDGSITLTEDMIGSVKLRDWIIAEFADCFRLAQHGSHYADR